MLLTIEITADTPATAPALIDVFVNEPSQVAKNVLANATRTNHASCFNWLDVGLLT